ncbi:FecR domain-containing protein [Achromobacter xylosoxidans]
MGAPAIGGGRRRRSRGCHAWLARDPAHRKAWERLERIGRDARRVPAALAHAALEGPAMPRRRAILRNVLTLAGVGMAGWAGYRHAPWQRLAANLSTGIGERRAVAVADGLHITLNSDSALRLRLEDGTRGIHLLRGEILVDAQSRPGAPALRVDTGYGVLLAGSARFDVRRTPHGARLGVYEGSVALQREAVHPDRRRGRTPGLRRPGRRRTAGGGSGSPGLGRRPGGGQGLAPGLFRRLPGAPAGRPDPGGSGGGGPAAVGRLPAGRCRARTQGA